MTALRSIAALALGASIVVACGGGAPVASAPGGGVIATNPAGARSAPPVASAPGGGGGPGTTIAACDLLTDEDIEQVTGQEISEEVAGPVLGIYNNGCEWTVAPTDTLAEGDITLGVIAPGGRSYYERYFEPFIGDSSLGLEEAIEGLGDKALLTDTGGTMVVKGDVMIYVEHFAIGNDEATARLLVDRILPRLP